MPQYRTIIHRTTGAIVGPVVPVSPEDWPYGEIRHSETLWRYMDFWKFKDLLETSALYFARSDQFRDPFEGRLSPGNATQMSASDRAFYSAYPIESSAKELEVSREIMRQVVFICCWHRNTKESRQMWQAYTAGPESLVVTTSAKALYRFLPEHIKKSPVKYHALNFPRTEFGHTTLFYYKPAAYRFEREFRLMLAPAEDESTKPAELGRHISISLKKIIHRVFTHPRASEELKMKVEASMQEHQTKRRR